MIIAVVFQAQCKKNPFIKSALKLSIKVTVRQWRAAVYTQSHKADKTGPKANR